MTFQEAEDNICELKEQGVKALIEIKNKDSLNNIPLKLVKAEVEDEDTLDQLLSDGIKIGYMHFKNEINRKSPKQCYKYKEFGHIATTCINPERCDRCSDEKHDGDCERDI